MLKIYFKDEGDETFIELETPIPGSWLHSECATPDDIEKIAFLLEVEPEVLHDSLDKFELPRVERHCDLILVYNRYPCQIDLGIYTTTLTVILSKDYIITISPSTCHLLREFIRKKSRITTFQKSQFLFHVLLLITQEYTKKSKQIRSDVIVKERDLNNVGSEDITELTVKEEYLNQCVSSLAPQTKLIEDLLSGRFTVVQEKDQSLLEDLLLSSHQAEDLCRLNLRMLRGLRNSVQIIFTNQLNKTIKLLTALTIILNFPTMISSLYGMNVALPFSTSRHAFIIIVSFITIVSVTATILFQRRRWL